MGIFSGGGSSGGGSSGQMMLPPSNLPDFAQPTPADLPDAPAPVPSNVPTPLDPTQMAAYQAAKARAKGMAGYASTITTSGFGVLTPVNTTAGMKSPTGVLPSGGSDLYAI